MYSNNKEATKMKTIGRSDYMKQYGGVGAFIGAAFGAGLGTVGLYSFNFITGVITLGVVGALLGAAYGFLTGRDEDDFV